MISVDPKGKVKGLFKLHDQAGFSLTDSLMECAKRQWRPDWHDWYISAHASGWPFDRTRRVVEQAIADSMWPQRFIDTTLEVFDEIVPSHGVSR